MDAYYTAAFDKYCDTVYRLALSRMKNKYDAEDIVQEVFVRLIRSGKQPSDEEHLKALLIRITVNCSKSGLMSAWRKNTTELDEKIHTPDKSCEVFDAVLHLPSKYSTVIYLHYYCGYSVEEISGILTCSAGAVKTRLFRAREMLKCDLEGVEF